MPFKRESDWLIINFFDSFPSCFICIFPYSPENKIKAKKVKCIIVNCLPSYSPSKKSEKEKSYE